MRQHKVAAALAAALVCALAMPNRASAQDTTARRRPSPTTTRPTTRRGAPIEIRGTVPTPQVVTVRPRETPTYDRRVLVPNFYNHDFWASSILPGYQIVQRRSLTGALPGDSIAAPPAAPPANTGTTPPAAGTDSTRRPPGTAPARTTR
jgi:hypothetical protein